jgi:glycosyltransferase involved in cell wall biosynthesis
MEKFSKKDDRMLKIAIDNTFSYLKDKNIDGMGIYTQNIIEYLKKDNVLVQEYISRAFRGQVDLDKVCESKAFLSSLPYLIHEALYNLTTYSMDEKKLDVDIFFSTDHRIPSFKNLPVVATVHDSIILSNPEWINTYFQRYKEYCFYKAAQRTEKIICISEYAKKDIIHYLNIPEEKCEVIYHGINEVFFETKKDNNVLKKYTLENKKYILFVSTIQPRKNHINLINAYNILPNKIKQEYELVFVGHYGWGCDDVLNAIKTLNIKWLQQVSQNELYILLQQSSLFVFPSLFEGFGFPPLEAMASQVPVIASNKTTIPEVCEDAALYFDPLNIVDIRDKILDVLNNESLQKELIQKGIKQAKKFTWKKSAEKHLKLFKSIVS